MAILGGGSPHPSHGHSALLLGYLILINPGASISQLSALSLSLSAFPC